jgi:Protein of unknown function (DUF1566)
MKQTKRPRKTLRVRTEGNHMSAGLAPAAVARFIKLGADGAELPADATAAVAIKDTKSGLTWSLEETKRMTWDEAQAHCASLTLLGVTDWRLPTCDELLTLVDRSRVSPAIDVAYFPGCKNSWYWSATPYASSPGDSAWVVDFSGGGAGWGVQDDGYYVRAVRASQS